MKTLLILVPCLLLATGAAHATDPAARAARAKAAADAAAAAAAPMMPHAEDFTVTTILLNSPPMAVINGKEMEEGEIVAFPIGGQQVTVQLMAVQDGRVILRWQNQNIVVALHRDENLTGIYNGQPATAALR
jgi:ABC-type amino acid transport substrate-binding protein